MGCAQVLWLFGKEQFVTEVGTMNCFVFWKNEQGNSTVWLVCMACRDLIHWSGEKELITAPLDGTILPGVTRDCILHLAREWGEFKVYCHKVISELHFWADNASGVRTAIHNAPD